MLRSDRQIVSHIEHRNLIKREAKKDKEEWLGQYCEETEIQLNRGNTEQSYKIIRTFLWKTQNKSYSY